MPNSIKYSTSAQSLALKKGNFWIGTGDVEKGPTPSTDYWNGITPPSGGYTVYLNKDSQGPSILCPANDSNLINLTNSISGQNFVTPETALNWYNTQTDKMVFNRDYESIITNGLILNLDPGFTPSYPKGGTSWYDISSSGNNGALINGPTFSTGGGGSIVFDGIDDFALVGSSTPASLIGNPAFSIGGWFKRSGDWSNGSTWGIGGDSGSQGINSWNFVYLNEITIDLWGTSTYSTSQTYSSTEWKYIIWTYNGSSFTTSNIIIYINGTPYTGSSLAILRGGGGTPNINSSGIVLGRAGVNTLNYYSKPIIGEFLIYNRVLSQSEVLQNYNATKGRYQLFFTDLFGVPNAAYSLRKLSPNSVYSGAAIRVRRSSDNTEQDINFLSGEENSTIDTAALLSFCGAGNGFVTRLYDQSGNGRNATQTTAIDQPQIVSSGNLITTNGKPSLKFDGVSDFLSTSYTVPSIGNITVESVQKINTTANQLSITISESAGTQLYLQWLNAGNFRNYYAGSANDVAGTTNQILASFYMGSGGGGFYTNGTLISSRSQVNTTGNSTVTIGKWSGGTLPSDMNFQELIIWGSDKQSDRTNIQSNINNYYVIY